MGHRERILHAIAHEEVDRVPAFFFAEKEVEARVCQDLQLTDLPAILRHFDVDTVRAELVLKNDATPFPDLTAVADEADIDRVPWPGGADVDLEASVRSAAAARSSGLAVLGGVWASIFTIPRRSMGEERFLHALIDAPALVEAVVARTADSYIAQNTAYFGACGGNVDIFFFGSDFGTQRSLFISAAMFRRFFKPHMRRIVQHAKGYGVRVMYHTCGAVADIIPDLIECGIDALDPVQVSARGMDTASLAAAFRGRIAFHGGISTQTLLPFASPEEVYRTTQATIRVLGPSGYIAGPDQYMIGDIPTDNITAMYQAIHNYRI